MTIPSFIQHSRACSNCWIWAVREKSDPEPGEIFCQLYNTFVVLFFDSWELPNPIGLSDHHCLRIIRFPWKNYIDCHWVEGLQRLSLCWTGPQQFSKASFCRSRGVSEETIDRKITSLHIFFWGASTIRQHILTLKAIWSTVKTSHKHSQQLVEHNKWQ